MHMTLAILVALWWGGWYLAIAQKLGWLDKQDKADKDGT